jgi:hypothetical protein
VIARVKVALRAHCYYQGKSEYYSGRTGIPAVPTRSDEAMMKRGSAHYPYGSEWFTGASDSLLAMSSVDQ